MNRSATSIANCTDDQLVCLSLSNQMEAGQELYIRYALFLFRLAYRITRDKSVSEDLCQETWLRIFKNLSRYNPGTSFRSWSAAICYRLCIDYFRKKKHRDQIDGGTVQTFLYQDDMHPRRHAVQKEFLSRILKRVRTVPEQYRTAFLLRFYEDLSYPEISQILDCPIKTVRSKVYRAIQILRIYCLEQEALT